MNCCSKHNALESKACSHNSIEITIKIPRMGDRRIEKKSYIAYSSHLVQSSPNKRQAPGGQVAVPFSALLGHDQQEEWQTSYPAHQTSSRGIRGVDFVESSSKIGRDLVGGYPRRHCTELAQRFRGFGGSTVIDCTVCFDPRSERRFLRPLRLEVCGKAS